MSELNEIGLKYATDKASSTHGYLDTYEKYLSPFKDEAITLLEVGVAAGNSLKMWREYLPKANVYGIDNNSDCAGYGEGIFIGNQTDFDFLMSIVQKIGKPNIIIDDGGHVGSETIETFKILFPLTQSDGLYIVEDTHCFYSEHYSGAFTGNGRSEVFNFFSGLAYDVDVAGRGMCGNALFAIEHPTENPHVPEYSRMLESMHIHTSLWFLKRR